MPLSTTITRHVTNPRKIAWISATVGFIFFVFFITIALTVTSHTRSLEHDRLAHNMQGYVIDTFNDLRKTSDPLRAFMQMPCSLVNRELTSRAAFANDIREILLIRGGKAYCSSATGELLLDVDKISPQSNLDNSLDLRLFAGTPMLPQKPTLTLWIGQPGTVKSGVLTTLNLNLTPYLLLASRQQEVSGIALITGGKAITSWENHIVDAQALPAHPLRTLFIPGYPLTLHLYGNTLPQRDVHFILLTGLLLAVLVTCGCFRLMTLRLRPGKEILLGIKRDEFHVEYQPVIEASSGLIYGFEALLRWTHSTEGHIPPDAFISYAEGQNLIVPLTRHLFKLVARDADKLRQIVPAGTQLGLNLSPNHLSSDSFRTDVKEWIAAMPQDHFSYVFEITERAMVSERNAGEIFDWIHTQGVKIAIDDFGTGHSALIYLEKFTFDFLKIDRGFVQSIGRETVTSPVLDAVLNLAKKLNLNTVAEGVETQEQARWLIKRGVTHLQGYLYSHPMTVAQVMEYCQKPSNGAVIDN